MRVLLIGEFSGVHNNLKVGLEELGVEVVLANTGDGFKKFSTDMLMRVEREGKIAKLQNALLEMNFLHSMKKFDVIQIMHPNALSFYNHERVFKALDSAKLVVQLIGGCDFVFAHNYKYLNDQMCKMCKKYDQPRHICPYTQSGKIGYEREMYQHVDVFVPLSWEYYYLYKEYMPQYASKLHSIIPMPMDLEKNIVPKQMNKKIQVLHPLNRRGFKGTKQIEKAFEILKEECGDIAEFHIKGRMPIKEYNKYLSRMDVVVDQLYCNTYGMNALYAMAKGKVAFSGNPDERMYMDQPILKEMPVWSLGYTVEEMVDSISKVLKEDNLMQRKAEARAYVEKHHDARKVAKEYLRLYKQYL